MILNKRFQVQGSGFKGYNNMILDKLQHANRADRFQPLGRKACHHYGYNTHL